VRVLYNKKGGRGDGDRQSFAFFIVGAVVVLIAVFLIGIYFGRELEKGGGPAFDNHAYRSAGEGQKAEWAVQGQAAADHGPDNVRKEMSSFSEEAVRVPVVPPGRAEAVAPPAEAEPPLTFHESLARKDDEPVPLEKPSQKAPDAKSAKGADKREGGFTIQAGAFKDKDKAESRKAVMEKAGFSVRIARSGNGGKDGLYVVVAGPYSDRESARGAISRLKSEHKIDAILSKG
jgi:cell division protein FtsN